ncbi:MAG: hypothetical protein PHN85_08325 [Kiritimatiellae bacterium]|nr:hypothetical protein [Kiritimatiellia bacterium]
MIGALVLAATEIAWDQSTLPTSLADGKVTAAYDDEGRLTQLSVDPAEIGGLEFTGGTMDFSSTGTTVTALSSGEIVFTNTLQIVGADAGDPAELAFDFPLTTNSIEVTAPSSYSDYMNLVQGLTLTDIQDVAVKVNDYQMPHLPFVWAENGQSFICEFQHWFSPATLRAFVFEFRQQESLLQYRFRGYRHLTDANHILLNYPNDCEQTIFYAAFPAEWPEELQGGYSVSTACPGNYVPTSPLTVTFSRPILANSAVFHLRSENALDNVAFKVGGTLPGTVWIEHIHALPQSGAIEVGAGSVLALNTYRPSTEILFGCDNGVPITVRNGGELLYNRVYQLHTGLSHVILDSGRMRTVNSGEPGNYVRNITLRNGARLAGTGALRVRSNNAVWKVEGTTPSSCECGFTAWRADTKKEGVFTLDVDDVTGDAQADFIVSGPVTRGTADVWNEVAVAKTGAGTMAVSNSYGLDTRNTTISSGVMEFGHAVIGSGVPFAIAGGVFALADHATNAVTTALSVTGSGGITLGTGSSMSFADSSAQSWAADATLTVSGDLTQGKLRFGTSPAALTHLQLKQIVFEGDGGAEFRAVLDDDGYLNKTAKSGLTLTLR